MPASIPSQKILSLVLTIGVVIAALLFASEVLDLSLDHLRGDIGE